MIYFLIPVYNEEQNLVRLLEDTCLCMREMGRRDFSFIFVNDGSTDGSVKLIEGFTEVEKTLLSHHPNKGVRTTFTEGFEEFLRVGRPGDILITKEADNTSDNSIAERMIASVSDGGYDIALASCYAKGGGLEATTPLRLLLSSSANLLIKVRFNMWGVHTFSSFYRAFTYECLSKAFADDPRLMTSEGFACVVEMLIKLKRRGFRITEIPMTLRSSERLGKSKMPIIRTIAEYIKLSFGKFDNR